MSTKSINPQREKSTAISNGNTAASLQVSLPQMLDLALGTPEVGAVNFNILHNFLHVVLHQINLRTTKVEYRGEDANRIKTMVTSLNDGPSLHLHEYSITDSSGRIKQRIHSDENLTVNVDIYTNHDANAKVSRGSVSARETRSKQEMDIEKKKVKGVKQQISGKKEGEFESVIFVEPIVDGTTPTALSFKKLENSVQKLQQQFQFLEELATNPELINKVKGNNTDPLKDMWQIININKRLDASEQGINKLTSMLQDIIKSDKIEVQNESSDVTTQLTEIDQRMSNLEETIKRLFEEKNSIPQNIENSEPNSIERKSNSKNTEKISNEYEERNKSTEEINTLVQDSIENKDDFSEILANVNSLKNDVNQVRNDIAELKSKFTKTSEHNLRSEEIKSGIVESKEETEIEATTETDGIKNKSITSIKHKEQNSKSEFEEENLKHKKSEQKETTVNQRSSTIAAKESNVEKLALCLEAVQKVETIETAMKELSTRVDNLEKSTTHLSEIANNLPVSEVNSDKEKNELQTKIQKIEDEMEKLIQTNKIAEDKDDVTVNKNTLQEQIEILKVVKVDKEDLEDALANKADTMTVSRKVSYDQFDVTRDDLTRGLEEAFDKLNQQESIMQHALDEVHKEIDGKLDKQEISPFKESVDNKFQRLQEKLKILSEIREPTEAAATKRMLRDVQCLSCDKDVVMRMHDNNPMYVTALSSIKKLQLRTQSKKLPPQRKDMLYLEAALKEERKSKGSSLPKNGNHFSNRYCGGSHTIITPQQKIMRDGHFLNQWGPQVIQLPAGIIEGSDGKTYRSRLLVGEPNKNEKKICDPCDNKCNSQQILKENLVPVPNQQSIEKKGSYVSEEEEKELVDRVSVGSREEIYKHSKEEYEMIMEEYPSFLPSPPLEEKDKQESLSKTMGVGSFFEESKSIAQIAFEEDNDEFEELMDDN